MELLFTTKICKNIKEDKEMFGVLVLYLILIILNLFTLIAYIVLVVIKQICIHVVFGRNLQSKETESDYDLACSHIK